jgi:hypothetical protein
MAGTRTRDVIETGSVARPDAYMGMLIVSLVATFIGLIFLWLDYSSYPDKNAPKPALTAPKLGSPNP